MLSFVAAGPLPPYNDFAAGYYRPGAPAQFVPMVGSCPTREVATREAERLNAEAAARQTGAFIEHSLRGTARGWYTEEMP